MTPTWWVLSVARTNPQKIVANQTLNDAKTITMENSQHQVPLSKPYWGSHLHHPNRVSLSNLILTNFYWGATEGLFMSCISTWNGSNTSADGTARCDLHHRSPSPRRPGHHTSCFCRGQHYCVGQCTPTQARTSRTRNVFLPLAVRAISTLLPQAPVGHF